MKILIITAVFPPEPVVSATISYDLAAALAEDHTVTVICPPPTRPLGYDLKQSGLPPMNFTRVVLHSYTCPEAKLSGRLWESLSFGKHCADYIRQNRQNIDLVYFNAWPLFSQFYIARTAKKLNIPYVVHIQDIYPETILRKNAWLTRVPFNLLVKMDRYVLSHARSIVTISTQMRNYLQSTRQINSGIDVVYNWQNQDNAMESKAQNRQESKFVFMFLGSISPTAGIDVLIRGFCAANLAGAKLVLAGAGSDKQRLMDIAAAHPGHEIIFMEARKEAVAELQRSADVLLISLKQGNGQYAVPSKLSSYLFSAKPVLACVDPGSPVAEIVSEANCGWVCNVNDPATITAAFQRASSTSELQRQQMGRNGKTYAEANLSRQANLSHLKKIVAAAND